MSDGRVLVLDAYIGGTVYFQEFADQDDADPVKNRVAKDMAFDGIERLFKLLANGDLAAVNQVGWKDAV